MRFRLRVLSIVLCIAEILCARSARAYSVLTHEQLIDLTWEQSIVPLLLSRYPGLTLEQVEQARAYAYGGCVIQDIGYYPFGDVFFSNLTHYVRSGDFVVNLFRNAGNANELAFAVGALSHYIGDTVGHAEATNLAVPIEFPKLGERYGKSVSYAHGEHQHVQTEFAFDINEIAHGRFAPVHYLRHVGLQVPVQQLALAFYQTYGLRDDFSVGRGHRVNVRAYRFAVRNFIPRIAYAVTVLHKKHEPMDDPQDVDLQKLQTEIRAVAAKSNWDQYRRKAGIGTYCLAGVIYVLPKIGPLKLVAVKGPTAQTEASYVRSVNQSTDRLNRALRRFTLPSTVTAAKNVSVEPVAAQTVTQQTILLDVADPRHPLPNRDLDTGNIVQPGGYRLTDDTYADLLHRLVERPAETVPPAIKEDILQYYADMNVPFATKKKPERWAILQADLVTLRGMTTSPEAAPYLTNEEE